MCRLGAEKILNMIFRFNLDLQLTDPKQGMAGHRSAGINHHLHRGAGCQFGLLRIRHGSPDFFFRHFCFVATNQKGARRIQIVHAFRRAYIRIAIGPSESVDFFPPDSHGAGNYKNSFKKIIGSKFRSI